VAPCTLGSRLFRATVVRLFNGPQCSSSSLSASSLFGSPDSGVIPSEQSLGGGSTGGLLAENIWPSEYPPPSALPPSRAARSVHTDGFRPRRIPELSPLSFVVVIIIECSIGVLWPYPPSESRDSSGDCPRILRPNSSSSCESSDDTPAVSIRRHQIVRAIVCFGCPPVDG